jgi:hypothetical protein
VGSVDLTSWGQSIVYDRCIIWFLLGKAPEATVMMPKLYRSSIRPNNILVVVLPIVASLLVDSILSHPYTEVRIGIIGANNEDHPTPYYYDSTGTAEKKIVLARLTGLFDDKDTTDSNHNETKTYRSSKNTGDGLDVKYIDSFVLDFRNLPRRFHHGRNKTDVTDRSTSNENDDSIVRYIRRGWETSVDLNTNEDIDIWHGITTIVPAPGTKTETGPSDRRTSDQTQQHSFATFLIRHGTREIHGSCTTRFGTYSISRINSNQYGHISNLLQQNSTSSLYRVEETLWDDFPRHDENSGVPKLPENDRVMMSLSSSRRERLKKEGDSFRTSVVMSESSMEDDDVRGVSPLLPAPGLKSGTVTSPTAYVDVMVLVTNRARCEVAGTTVGCPLNFTNTMPIDNKIALVAAQTNKVFQDLAINVRIRIVRTSYLAAPADPNVDLYCNSTQPLNVMENDASVKKWRNESGADLVTMVTGTTIRNTGEATANVPKCGVSRQFGFTSATDYKCLDTYGFTKQLGYNFDCHPNREDSARQTNYSHGYRYKNIARTIMSANCPGSGCPLYPFFSADGRTLNISSEIVPLGNATSDNVRRICETGPILESYRRTLQTFEPTVAPTSAPTNVYHCSKESDPGEPLGWFLYPTCPDTNRMYRFVLGGFVCVQKCVDQPEVFAHQDVGWKCGRCFTRFRRKSRN